MNNYFRTGRMVLFVAICILPNVSSDHGMAMGGKPGVPNVHIEEQSAMLSTIFRRFASVFMKIRNSGNGDDALISARMNIPGTLVEMHDVKNGKMTRVDRIPVPSGATTVLRPGGLHIMIFQLPKDVSDGSEITLILKFELSGEMQIPVIIKR